MTYYPPRAHVLHLRDDASNISGYKRMILLPLVPGTEATLTGASNLSSEVLIKAFSSDALGCTQLPAGIWRFSLAACVDSATDITKIKIYVYSRNQAGTETALFNMLTAEIDNTSVALVTTLSSSQAAFTVADTDRLVVKIYVVSDSGTDKTVTLYYQGAVNYSTILLPDDIPVPLGDMIKAIYDPDGDGSAAGGGSGDVVGPASSTDGDVPTYDGATGKLLKDTGIINVGKRAGASGGTITDVDIGGILYRIHKFTASGTFHPTDGVTLADILVVGGGGGGGGGQAFVCDNVGGGGGEVLYEAAHAITDANVTITVGAGAAYAENNNSSAGASSSFGAVIVARGGGGCTVPGYAGASGSTVHPGGRYGGGGGDSEDGTAGGDQGGGDGTMCAITGANVYYAGGGHGAYGANTHGLGSGPNSGGGGQYIVTADDGVVIIRYVIPDLVTIDADLDVVGSVNIPTGESYKINDVPLELANVALATHAANLVFSGPATGAAAVPTFRALVTDDIPANIITLAKMATQAAETFLANATSGVAVPTALAVAEQTLIGRITSGHIVGLTVAQIKTLLAYAIGDLATIATDTVLTNSTAGSAAPAALALAEQTVLGRITGGHIVGLTAAQILTIVNVAAGAQVNVLEGVTGTAPIVAGAVTAKSQAISISAATTSVPGSMSAADKTKLDGIAASANNYVHPNHSGEVTSAGDGAQTIAAKAVTLAKMADLAANSIIGNNTGSPATPLALSVAQVIALLGVTPTDLLAIARGWYFS